MSPYFCAIEPDREPAPPAVSGPAARLLAAILAALVLCPPIAGAQTADAGRGREIAQRQCSSCHIVAPDQQKASADGVPSLPAVMQRPAIDAAWLRAFLASPHQRMPQVALMRDEQEALIAYLVSLRPAAR